jgi:Zn-dependent protease
MNEHALFDISIMLIPLIFGITVHEYAHGFAADKLGDKTARMLGRLSINPINHIDFFGTLILPIGVAVATSGAIFFGYAKPVPISPHNFKNLRKGIIISTLAGPLSNFVMALFWSFGLLATPHIPHHGFSTALFAISIMGIKINTVLGVLNLLPIPPLDGSKVISVLLPKSIHTHLFNHEQYGLIILLAMSISGILSTVIDPMVKTVLGFYMNLIGLLS